jgi:hypothetical protein
MATTLDNLIDQALDIAGSVIHDAAMPFDEEDSFLGSQISGQSGSSASVISGAGAGNKRIDGVSGMSDANLGNFLTITNSTDNDGTFMIVAVVDADTVDVADASPGTIPDASNGSIDWQERNPYSLSDDVNYARSDRQAIKGVDFHAAIPTYERPNAVGTDVDANLANIAGVTLDAHATVRNVRYPDITLHPSIADGDGAALVADETFTTTGFHFTADDVDSLITITDGTSTGAAGTYRIKTVTDGQTLELDGFAPTGAGTCTWVREGDVKGILTSRGFADAVDRTGIPIADSGAEDETYWDATLAEVQELTHGGAVALTEDEAGLPIFSRQFGDELDPNATVTNEAVRFFIQLLTGDNDGTATDSALEPIAGRSGSAASLVGGDKQITGLSGMIASDVDKYITIWNLANDEAGHYKIVSVDSATAVTVERAAGNFTADASGAIEWQVSRHSGELTIYGGDRFRRDQLDETWARTILVGGSGGNSELVIDISDIRETIGINDGDTDLSTHLTNTGNFFPFSDLPDATPSVVEALNTLNEQIGDRNFTSAVLTDGADITTLLDELAAEIASTSGKTRYIDELSAALAPGATYTLPGGASFTPDGTGNGQTLWLFSRGILRHPGTNVAKHDYTEDAGAPSTSVTLLRAFTGSDIIDVFVD